MPKPMSTKATIEHLETAMRGVETTKLPIQAKADKLAAALERMAEGLQLYQEAVEEPVTSDKAARDEVGASLASAKNALRTIFAVRLRNGFTEVHGYDPNKLGEAMTFCGESLDNHAEIIEGYSVDISCGKCREYVEEFGPAAKATT